MWKITKRKNFNHDSYVVIWTFNGVRHRVDGPSVIYELGHFFYVDGELIKSKLIYPYYGLRET